MPVQQVGGCRQRSDEDKVSAVQDSSVVSTAVRGEVVAEGTLGDCVDWCVDGYGILRVKEDRGGVNAEGKRTPMFALSVGVDGRLSLCVTSQVALSSRQNGWG